MSLEPPWVFSFKHVCEILIWHDVIFQLLATAHLLYIIYPPSPGVCQVCIWVDWVKTAEHHCSVSRTGQMIRITVRNGRVHHPVFLQREEHTLSSHHCAVSSLFLLCHTHIVLCSSTYCHSALIRCPLRFFQPDRQHKITHSHTLLALL